MPELKSEIRDTLESNPELHFTSSTLQDKFEARDVQVRGAVHKLREAGLPIISSYRGFKWAESREEINNCLDDLFSMIKFIESATEGLIESKKRFLTQKVYESQAEASISEHCHKKVINPIWEFV